MAVTDTAIQTAGAVKDCDEDQKRFFIKLKFGKLPEGAEPIFPRRP